jgi:hypothetical protein
MNYQRTKKPSGNITKILIAVAVVLVLLRLVIPHAFAAFFADVFSPFWRIEQFALSEVVPEHQLVFSSDSAFGSSTVAALLQENNDMADMLGRPAAPNAVIAAVLSKPPFEAYDTLIVDAGSAQGIAVGDKVYALANPVVYSTVGDLPPSASSATTTMASSTSASSSVTTAPVLVSTKNGAIVPMTDQATSTASASSTESNAPANPQIEIPIGQIAAAYGDTSSVVLYSSPGQQYPVQIGEYHISATATAEGAGMFEAMVPNNSNIQVGDPVMIPGIQTGVFASVVSIVSDPARPYSVVLFQSPVDPFSLYIVEVEKADSSGAVGANVAANVQTSHETK